MCRYYLLRACLGITVLVREALSEMHLVSALAYCSTLAYAAHISQSTCSFMVLTRASKRMVTRSQGRSHDDQVMLTGLTKKRKASTGAAGSNTRVKLTSIKAGAEVSQADLSREKSR